MDPFTAIGAVTSAVGLGMKLFGGADASSKASQAYGIEKDITGLERQINDQRRVAMELSARRQTMEVYRNSQKLRAQGINSAVNQGVSLNSSGVQGGVSENTSQSQFSLMGISQNLQIGRNIFGLNDQISDRKMQLSDVKSQMNDAQGMASLGGALLSSGGTIGNIFGAGAGFASSAMSLFSDGSLSGGLTNRR